MWPLIRLAIAVIGGIALLSSSEETAVEPTDESNCDEEFLEFDKTLDILPSKKKELVKVREKLQTSIRNFWSNNLKVKLKGFYIQGSYKHGTTIRKHDDSCDVDVGIYFDGRPEISPLTIRNNMADLFANRTEEKPEKRNKCLRIFYANQFHIDFPIYYFDNNTGKYYLGVCDSNTWELCDPKAFTKWFKENIAVDSQKKRLVKYFKSWAATYSKRAGRKMPSGLAFTVLINNNFKEHKREDLAFIQTASEIYTKSKNSDKENWVCKMPVEPGDNLVRKLNLDQREYFLEALDELITSSKKIFKLSSKSECVEEWKKLLGKWFPDEIKHEGVT